MKNNLPINSDSRLYEKIIAIKNSLQNGEATIGSWMQLANASVAEIMGQCGYDWVAIDLEHGAFSFLKGKANTRYYNATISRGLPEPDIHGTVMFVNGIALIAELLGIRENLGINDIEDMRCPEAYII